MSYRSHVTHATYATARWKIIFAFTTLCVVWSSTWLAIKIGLADLPPISFAAIRFLIAFVVLVAVSIGRVPLLPKNRTRLDAARLHRRSHVRDELRPAFLGRAARLLRAGGGPAGDDSSCGHDLRTLVASGGAVALATGRRCGSGRERRRANLRTPVRSRRHSRFLGRARDCHWRRRRGFFKRAPETARLATGSGDDRRLANDLRHHPVALVRPDRRGQPAPLSLDRPRRSFACSTSRSLAPR